MALLIVSSIGYLVPHPSFYEGAQIEEMMTKVSHIYSISDNSFQKGRTRRFAPTGTV